MWWMLYPHGVTAACKVSESVPALQQISANFCRGGEKMMLWDLYTSFICFRSRTQTAIKSRKDPSDRRILGLVSASHRCWGLSVPDNASEARTVWSGRKVKETQLYMYVKWWWNSGRVLQWAVPHPSGSSQEKKIPAVFMTSTTHTGILIAASLLRGEEIDYLKASPSRPHFHVPFPLRCTPSFFPSCLIILSIKSFPPPASHGFPPPPHPMDERKSTRVCFSIWMCNKWCVKRATAKCKEMVKEKDKTLRSVGDEIKPIKLENDIKEWWQKVRQIVPD